jgi:hypothetical protein
MPMSLSLFHHKEPIYLHFKNGQAFLSTSRM